MHECPKCGYSAKEKEVSRPEFDMDDDKEVSMKDEILSELIEMMQNSVGDKLKPKKDEEEDSY